MQKYQDNLIEKQLIHIQQQMQILILGKNPKQTRYVIAPQIW